MFSHRGKSRTLNHNLKIASLLSFIAGIVNVAGFLSIQRLTTNVTGHFAFFVDEVFKLHFLQSIVFLSYILFFLFGSLVSNFLGEVFYRRNAKYEFVVPASLEILILLLVAVLWPHAITRYPDVIAFSLLFAMGLQNSLVTRISGAMIRTTHLTGLFTDLGIELSQLFFYKAASERTKLKSNITLRVIIILFFFLGGIIGGICYTWFNLYVLIIPCIALGIGLLSNRIKLEVIRWRRKQGKTKDV